MITNDIQYAIILQDNTLLYDNFVNNIVNYFKQLPDNWDFLFFGSGLISAIFSQNIL